MSTSNQHEPCFRIYLGKSNWVNLNPQATSDLKAIYQKGKPTRYKLAPGLFIDILPRDVDCNSKTTELPRLMRADLCYDDDDEGNIAAQIKAKNATNQDATAMSSSSSTLAERQEAVQQNLSRFIKAELEKQGIVDAFPPIDPGQELLPQVSTLAPHRHLGLVPAPHKSKKRTLQRQKQQPSVERRPSPSVPSSQSPSLASSSSPLIDASYTPTSTKPIAKRKSSSKKTRKNAKNTTALSSTTSPSSGESTATTTNTPIKIAGKKVQPPVPYHLRSSSSSSNTEKKFKPGKSSTPHLANTVSSPLVDDVSISRVPLMSYPQKSMFDYEGKEDDDDMAGDNVNTNGSGRTNFFPAIDFITPTSQLSPFSYNHFQQQQHQQQQEQQPRTHPVTLSSPSMPIFYHHHHHHHQLQLQPRDHQFYHHARLPHFPDDGEDDDEGPPTGWNFNDWANHHHHHHRHHQHSAEDFDMYSSSMYAVSSPPPAPPAPPPPLSPFHRYDVDSVVKMGVDPSDLQQQQATTYSNDSENKADNTSSISVPSPSGTHSQLQLPIHSHQHHSLTNRYYPASQYTNISHLSSFFMPPAAATPTPSVTLVEDPPTTALLSTSSPSPTSSPSHFSVQGADTTL
ncbi:hypothetical protein BCR42DRAFT_437396 [Absidia repens]|uniref:Uncharacterized protein n=1 Tax=Absidia repens TaxID=90262 RepID=A0A1X2IKK4_9FUNG|nr:hypothetical protein BCR42DRAFT_437396 [Absidia repens]